MDTTTTVANRSWWQKLFNLPAGTKLIWWLIKIQYNWRWQIGGFFGFLILFRLGFQDWWAASAMILSMFLHEFGHLLVFLAKGIKAIILFLFPLGAVAAPANEVENKRSDELHWWDIATLLQAGPTANVILMIVGAVMLHYQFLPDFGKQLIAMNGMLAFMNLLPLGHLDGGQLFHVFFSSLNEDADRLLSFGLTIISGAIILELLGHPAMVGIWQLLGASINNVGIVLFLFLMTAGIWHKQGLDNPDHCKSRQAMTLNQVLFQLTWYAVLTTSTLLLWRII